MPTTIGIPPTHFQWREALLTTSTRAITAPLYGPGEAGFGGRAYNFVVRGLHATIEVMNVVLAIPMFLLVLAWGIVTLPLQLIRLVVSPTTFLAMSPIIIFPGAVLIWFLGLPVKVLNLLMAVIVYVWGPKLPAFLMDKEL